MTERDDCRGLPLRNDKGFYRLKSYNLDKTFNIEACAPYQSAIDVRLGHKAANCIGINASTVNYMEQSRETVFIYFSHDSANVCMHFLGLLRRRRPAGTDRPNGFIGNNDRFYIIRGEIIQSLFYLPFDNGKSPACLPLLEGFTYAEYGLQIEGDGGLELSINGIIIFAKDGSALRMTHDDVLTSGIYEHGGRYLSRI